MEEDEGTQICPNCNREIPKVNFVIHSVHCVRNIKICPVCKEAVPQSELDDHNDKLHLLVPCKQCGEMVRGTDMEDHTRDSCAFTNQTCRFCSLELRRRDVPAHERYCGARTERCADCGEYVMLRYRQLHLESNHGFVRLRDDSPPRPGTRVVDNTVPNRLPADRRPRFPPYVPLSRILPPAVSREESLRVIAECRAKHRESDPLPKLTDEDIRFRAIVSARIHLPLPDPRPHEDDGMGRLRDRERFTASLRGQARTRPSRPHNARWWEEMKDNVVPPDAVVDNVADGEAVAQNAVVEEAIVEQAMEPDDAARDAGAEDGINHEAEAIDAINHDAEAGAAVNHDAEPGEALNRDAVVDETVAQNLVVEEVVARDELARDAAARDVVAQDVEVGDVQDAMTQNTVVHDADAGEALVEVQVIGEEPEVLEIPRQRPSPGSRIRSNYRVILKRTNDQPQINTAVTAQDKLMKKLSTRALKKRPAPAAPPVAPAPDPRRDLPYYSALQRRQAEDRHREDQTAYNLSVGLPPVLDPAAKLEKLRKMDALHNREEVEPQDYRQRLQGRVWRENNNAPVARTVGRGATHTATTVPQSGEVEQQRRQLADVQPMSAEEFMERFNELQLFQEPAGGGTGGRFGDIRSSLRELRRGLNEVTAPYNNSASNNNNNNNNTNKNNNIIESNLLKDVLNGATGPDTAQLDEARALDHSERSPEADVLVPCEFCCEALRASDILEHERACRLELSSTRGYTASPTPPVTPTHFSRPHSPWDDDNIPVIPCEFCNEPLPFYLINEHQELCGRESNLLYPD